ncbi:UbiA family prenyltransferase [Streptomyces sp. NPDC001663]|uniref:UbiA family prenyltransferase n=1 Tax=Streptomyces sp. NPDC001663 TaxID=3364597 RepID=UPI0036CDB588
MDAVERPERPIPSGRVARRTALATACGLTAAALGLSALAGGCRALGVALPLTGLVWVYDLRLKSTQRTGRSGARTQGLRTAGRPADLRAHLHRHGTQPPRDLRGTPHSARRHPGRQHRNHPGYSGASRSTAKYAFEGRAIHGVRELPVAW